MRSTDYENTKLEEVLNRLHFTGSLPLDFINDGQPHEARSHTNNDDCHADAVKSIQALVAESKPESIQASEHKREDDGDDLRVMKCVGYNQALKDWEDNLREKGLIE